MIKPNPITNKPEPIPSGSAPKILRFAVLPFDSQAIAFDAERIMRYWINNRLQRRGYQTLALDKIDAVLKTSHGITQGGQLRSTTAEALGKSLDVHGLIYGDVGAFDGVNIAVLVKRKVQISLKMVDPQSGRTRWTGEGESFMANIAVKKDSIIDNFIGGLAESYKRKKSRTLFDEIAMDAADQSLFDFPKGVY
ncbi:MAG: hypothetical protein COB53_07660 [Elusimicrobia bacterium]|nr:MAG: hypothetical protein COB53_07660 [Elusimicrobiota bacterium]